MQLLVHIHLLVSVFALQSASAICHIDLARISKMGPQDPTLGYSLKVRKLTNNTFECTISNPVREDFQGLLMYTAAVRNSKVHVGKLTFANKSKWQYLSLTVCDRERVQGPLEATVTHRGPTRVGFDNVFILTLTDEELSVPNLDLHAIVASQDASGGFPKWQEVMIY
jgi:hypothetical protein